MAVNDYNSSLINLFGDHLLSINFMLLLCIFLDMKLTSHLCSTLLHIPECGPFRKQLWFDFLISLPVIPQHEMSHWPSHHIPHAFSSPSHLCYYVSVGFPSVFIFFCCQGLKQYSVALWLSNTPKINSGRPKVQAQHGEVLCSVSTRAEIKGILNWRLDLGNICFQASSGCW